MDLPSAISTIRFRNFWLPRGVFLHQKLVMFGMIVASLKDAISVPSQSSSVPIIFPTPFIN